MLKQVAEGVLVHESVFVQSNAVVVHGRAGVLLIDPGVQGHEMACLANDLSDSGQTVVAGFSTHPDWDHLLWHAQLGAAPRYGTARCAATVRYQLSDPDAKALIADHLLDTEIAGQVPLDLLGLITAPVEDYLSALRLLEDVAGDVDVVIPGHGSVGGGPDQVRARIERDRAYVLALREGRVPSDPRVGPSAEPGWEWVSDVHDGQPQGLARRSERDGTSS